jgi:hypothetical protein
MLNNLKTTAFPTCQRRKRLCKEDGKYIVGSFLSGNLKLPSSRLPGKRKKALFLMITSRAKSVAENLRYFRAMTTDLVSRWKELEMKLIASFGKTPDLNAILMMIGVQELRNTQTKFTKEEKQDLMHVAVCTLLAQSGYYAKEGYDEGGWPHFAQVKALPVNDLIEQELFLKDHVLLYFENHDITDENA